MQSRRLMKRKTYIDIPRFNNFYWITFVGLSTLDDWLIVEAGPNRLGCPCIGEDDSCLESVLHFDSRSPSFLGGLKFICPAVDLTGGVSSKIGLLGVSGRTIFTLKVVDKSFLQWACKTFKEDTLFILPVYCAVFSSFPWPYHFYPFLLVLCRKLFREMYCDVDSSIILDVIFIN